MIEQRIIPTYYYGPDSLAAFFLPLSPKLAETIRKNAFILAKAALTQLREAEIILKQRSDTSLELVKLIYDRESDANFDKAKRLLEEIIAYYRGIEIKRLRTLYDREVANHPASDETLGKLVVRTNPTAKARGQSAPKQPPAKKAKTSATAPRSETPPRRGGSQNRGRGRGRGNQGPAPRFNPYWRSPNRGRGNRGRGRVTYRGQGQARRITAEDLANALAPLFN